MSRVRRLIKLNVDKKKTVQEEVEEMEELDGLRGWLDRIKTIDWVEKPAALNQS